VKRPAVDHAAPMHLAIGSSSYLTHEFFRFMFPHDVDLSERQASQQACRVALEELRTEKPAYWSMLELHTFGRQTFPVCAAREGITVGAAQKRHQRALKCLEATALRIKTGIETDTR
jgi:hypothetical protein